MCKKIQKRAHSKWNFFLSHFSFILLLMHIYAWLLWVCVFFVRSFVVSSFYFCTQMHHAFASSNWIAFGITIYTNAYTRCIVLFLMCSLNFYDQHLLFIRASYDRCIQASLSLCVFSCCCFVVAFHAYLWVVNVYIVCTKYQNIKTKWKPDYHALTAFPTRGQKKQQQQKEMNEPRNVWDY